MSVLATNFGDDPATVMRTAQAHLQARQWSLAAVCLQPLVHHDIKARLKWHLARNLAALQQARPAVYDTILATPGTGQYQVVPTSTGHLSVIHQPSRTLMCSGPDPKASARQQIDRIAPALDQGRAAGLMGLGDGHLLTLLAARPSGGEAKTSGMTNALLLFEPSVDALMACLMLHDWSTATGPILQDRVHWYVGPRWRSAYAAATRDDLYLPAPDVCLAVGPTGKAIHHEVQSVINDLKAYDARLLRQVQAHYDQLTRDQLLEAFRSAGVTGSATGSRPRALVTTSRFTTVLRYAAADAADALASLGWDVRLSMEQHDWQRTSVVALRRHVAEHRPHLVLVIDHLRREYGDLYPPQLPFVCWIQDDLPALTDAEAGASLTPRDFVLTVSASMYRQHYSYPARQCITMTKLTRPPRPWTGPRLAPATPDVVYVSHAGRPPRALLDELVQEFVEVEGAAAFVEQCGSALIDHYRLGGCVHTLGQMDRFVREQEGLAGRSVFHRRVRDGILRRLMHPLNNTLYRQQALQWTLAAAAELGATVGLYGQGWDAHAPFAPYARGTVAYGDALAQLTRQAPVSLHIVPFHFLHQRLLDGLAAGGFFLIREHPSDSWRARWKAFVESMLPPDVASLEQARQALNASQLQQLNELLEESHDVSLIHGYDNLANYRDQHAQGLSFLYEDLPHREAVSFGDAASLRMRLQQFLRDDDAAERRRAIADPQRDWVLRHYTYEAGLSRALSRMASLLAEEP